MDKLFLMLIRYIVNHLELCVVDYQNGGFLPRPAKKELYNLLLKKELANWGSYREAAKSAS